MTHDLGVLRVKTDDPDSLHCHRQEVTLVTGTLAQKAIIVSKNSNVLIEIKAFSLLFFYFKKTTVKVILNFFHLPCHLHHLTYMTLIQFRF